MARIRTIKPEFFTSEDVVSVSPLARLLYAGLWCEADREGRVAWKPVTLAIRYMPREQDQFEAVACELTERNMVVLYGPGYAWIPTFLLHQRPNPREAKSVIPAPPVEIVDKFNRDYPQLHAANLDLHAQGGREGKEGKGREGGVRTPERQNPVDNKSESTPIPWWKSDAGIRAKGEELKLEPNRGEDWREYKARIFARIKDTEKTA